MSFDQFLYQIPDRFRGDPNAMEFFTRLVQWLDDVTRPDGVLDTAEQTAETTLTQQEKLDLISVVSLVDINATDTTATANKASLDALLTSLPAYTLSNWTTDRTLNADAAAGAISATPTQAEVEGIRDAVLGLADVVATIVNDMANKDILGA